MGKDKEIDRERKIVGMREREKDGGQIRKTGKD